MLREIIFASSVILVNQVSAVDCDSSANISERPKDAPVISKVEHDRAWYVQALHGISEPYNVDFIKNQGNWHTPFNEAGMLGPYDIRGWYE